MCALAPNCTLVSPTSLKPAGFSILGCQCKLDWQLQPWFFHGQNLLCQMSYTKDVLGVQRVSRNAPKHFLQVLIHSTQLQLIPTCVCPLRESSVPAPRTAWGCRGWCRFSGTPFQLVAAEGHRCSSFVQTSIKTVLQAPLWELSLLFTPDIFLKREKSLRMHKSDLRCFKRQWSSYHDWWTIKLAQLNG